MKKELSNEMTIGSMPVDVKAKLGTDVRRNLSEIIEHEFKSRVDIDYQAKNKRRAEIIETNKKRLGVDKLIKELIDAVAIVNKIKASIDKIGFSSQDGCYRNGNNIEIEEELNALNETSKEILTIKHKLQTRLSLSTTVGEATVIMHEILGNTLIPSLTTNAISFKND